MLPADPNRRTMAILAMVVVTMGSLAWAAVPFYSWFCRVTGYAGTTVRADAGSDRVLEREILIRFDANTADGMPWSFEPAQREMRIRLGETGLAFYRAHNPTSLPVAGTAVFNVAPDIAGGYFTKIECFCFTEQVLAPGETVEMPVSFYVDPAIADDPDAARVAHITLSYTFYQTDLPATDSRLATPAETGQETTN